MINEPRFFLANEQGFKGTFLDELLAAGYYRMQHMIFTTNQTSVNQQSETLPVFWLRTHIYQINESKTSRAIRKKCAAFTVEIKLACITPSINELFEKYYHHINFNPGQSCSEYLHDALLPNPFDSWMIEIKDGETLVAVGYFDLGKNSIAGILNFYHPNYKKYSLGKLLILKKIDYALQHNISLYYSGYLSTAITKFDYKLFPDKAAMQVYLPLQKIWLPFLQMDKIKLEAYYNNYLKK